jgi:hypothetical protein
MLAKILAIMLTVNGDRDVAREERIEFLKPVAEAIQEASGGSPDKAAFLLALGAKESHFARYVLEGRCLEGRFRCDVDKKTGLPQALGPWQLWKRACPKGHAEGAKSYLTQAKCALRLAKYHQKRCKTWPGTFSGYAGVGCSDAERWLRREQLRVSYLKRLQ